MLCGTDAPQSCSGRLHLGASAGVLPSSWHVPVFGLYAYGELPNEVALVASEVIAEEEPNALAQCT